MADPSQPQQPPLSATQASSDPTSKQKPLSPAPMASATKYDIAPPHPQEAGSSSGPTLSKPLTQASPTTPGTPSVMSATPSSLITPAAASLTTPSGSSSKMTNSAQLLANARAKLAAAKKTTTPSASKPSPDANVQVFEITHLKTIKCDVCEQKNGEILYKCQNCPDHHQICSRCVKNTEPQPAGITMGRKDWSVHAKLKDAHADYMQPICMHKKEDGGYEYDGVKFIMAQGKRSGIKKVRKATPKTKATAVERNSAVHRALGGNKTTQQGRRIEAMARAKLERSQDQNLRARVAAARARRAKQDEADGKVQPQAGEKKRKADVLDEDDDSSTDVDIENASELTTEEGNDEDSEATQNDGEGGWDPVETAAAMKESLRDIGRE
ncbi:hypothetical protein EPUS_07958 [Endocarpon pusillum Z07020]|uniref:ZZ-type domain-containing protein n=1 Tax=Endocarpon pusillum (strain Z07020 / HMAS-L-300199) TaxID=1263415 RepID=U1GH86_ENDPU|nr:uncharacterized protein EPUS_07958 [Endocarpon pusillum Z07020]ERF77052.1 hypothetical protein EPUS_07958 [Endocarpon pusillum Z07020]